MAHVNVAQPNEKILKSAASLEWVADSIDEREDQLWALVCAIRDRLSPEDERNIPDGHPIAAWRLAQVLEDMLSSTGHRNALRTMLMAPN